MTDEELQKPENWDFDAAERHPGSPQAGAVVSVAFHRDDFNRVGAAAQELGMRTSEFIRAAALEKASRHR